jgi:hypothetical protein
MNYVLLCTIHFNEFKLIMASRHPRSKRTADTRAIEADVAKAIASDEAVLSAAVIKDDADDADAKADALVKFYDEMYSQVDLAGGVGGTRDRIYTVIVHPASLGDALYVRFKGYFGAYNHIRKQRGQRSLFGTAIPNCYECVIEGVTIYYVRCDVTLQSAFLDNGDPCRPLVYVCIYDDTIGAQLKNKSICKKLRQYYENIYPTTESTPIAHRHMVAMGLLDSIWDVRYIGDLPEFMRVCPNISKFFDGREKKSFGKCCGDVARLLMRK